MSGHEAGTSPLTVSMIHEPQRVTVSVAGQLDAMTSARLDAALAVAERGRPTVLVLDLRRLDFIDSSGLKTVLAADARARGNDRRLEVVAEHDRVLRVFRITRTDTRLNLTAAMTPDDSGQRPVPDTDQVLAFEVPSDGTALPRLRQAVHAFAGRMLGEAELADVVLMVSELVTNSIRHVRTGSRIRVRLAIGAGHIRGEITDDGTGFVTPQTRRPADEADSGWGLYLVDRLADRWSAVQSAGASTVWFERDLVPYAPASEQNSSILERT